MQYKWALEVIKGGRLLDTVPLQDIPTLSLGTHVSNHLLCPNPSIDDHHVELRLIDGRYHLYDLSTTHGTKVNY